MPEYVMGTATPAGLPLKTKWQKQVFNRRLRESGVPLKLCGQCGATLALSNFHRHPTSPDGLQPACKPCRVKQDRARYLAKGAEMRAKTDARRATYPSRPLDIGDAHLPKRCVPSGCGQLKTRGDFPRSRDRSDQRSAYCHECNRKSAERRQWRWICREAHGAPEDNVCHLCGLAGMTEDTAQADHLIPRSKGGNDEPYNLRWTHAGCNRKKSNGNTTIAQLHRLVPEILPAESWARLLGKAA